jgi:hypothetical protein
MSGTAFNATNSSENVAWGYDALGQAVDANHDAAAKDFGYAYDEIGAWCYLSQFV